MSRSRDPSLRRSAGPAPMPAAEASASVRPSAAEEESLVGAVKFDLASLDASQDDTTPDAPVSALIPHAQALAVQARAHWPSLRRAKLAPDAPARLEAGIDLLRGAETRWSNLHAALLRQPSLADARATATEGRSDLFQALRLFGEDRPDLQSVLDALGTPSDDGALLADLDRLLALAADNAALFAGTDLTPERLATIRAEADTFRTVRAGAAAPEAGASSAALAQDAAAAYKLRNRAFWCVAAIERDVCKRARYIFRKDPRTAALFTLYTTALKPAPRPAKKPRTPDEGGGAPPA